jgi:hypothetical protein
MNKDRSLETVRTRDVDALPAGSGFTHAVSGLQALQTDVVNKAAAALRVRKSLWKVVVFGINEIRRQITKTC